MLSQRKVFSASRTPTAWFPYRLTEISGVGFLTADKIAMAMGITIAFTLHQMRHTKGRVEGPGNSKQHEREMIVFGRNRVIYVQ